MEQALKASEQAKKHRVLISELKEISADQKKLIKSRSSNDELVLFSLPGNNVCVPTFPESGGTEAVNFTHIMNNKVRCLSLPMQ